jgi:hypothetical protein
MKEQEAWPLPLALLVVAVFLMVAFQTFVLVRERTNLGRIRAAQETNIQEAAKLRRELQDLAAATAKLADAGDAGAKAVVEEMHRLGVNIKPPG